MKYLSIEEQKKLLENNEFDKLLKYATSHHLNKDVVKKLLLKLKELTRNDKPQSIH